MRVFAKYLNQTTCGSGVPVNIHLRIASEAFATFLIGWGTLTFGGLDIPETRRRKRNVQSYTIFIVI
jgi:hypothetical protein